MQLKEITTLDATRLADLIDFADNYWPLWGAGLLAFRGQPRTFGALRPSFSRRFEQSSTQNSAERIEAALLDSFRKHYRTMASRTYGMPDGNTIANEDRLAWLSVMQHYGVPTRLLDWTTDLWIAVYFACAGEPDEDAELWYYNRKVFGEAIEPQEKLARERCAILDPQVNSRLASAYALDRRQFPKLLLEVSERSTPRMTQQSAHHTVSADVFADHAPLIHALVGEAIKEPGVFGRVVIRKRCKDNVLNHLSEESKITASTLFPDIEGLGRFLRWQLDSLQTRYFNAATEAPPAKP